MVEQDKQKTVNTRLLTLAAAKEIKVAQESIGPNDRLTQEVLSAISTTSEATREWIERTLSKTAVDWQTIGDIGEHIATSLADTYIRLNILESTDHLPETWRIESETTHLVPANDPLVTSLFKAINERAQAALDESITRGKGGADARSATVMSQVMSSPKGINMRGIGKDAMEKITQRNKKLRKRNLRMHIRNGVAIMGSEERIYIPAPETQIQPPSPEEVLLQIASRSNKDEAVEFYKKLAVENLSTSQEEAQRILKMDEKKIKSFLDQQNKNCFRYYGYRIRRVNGRIFMERNKLREVTGRSKPTAKPPLPKHEMEKDFTDNKVAKQPNTNESYSETALRVLIELSKRIRLTERKLFITLLAQNPRGIKREDLLEQLKTTEENLQRIIRELNYIVLKKHGLRIRSVEDIVFIEISDEDLVNQFAEGIEQERKERAKEKARVAKEVKATKSAKDDERQAAKAARAAIALEKKVAKERTQKAATEAAKAAQEAQEKIAAEALAAEQAIISAQEEKHAKIDAHIVRLEVLRDKLDSELKRMRTSLGGLQSKLEKKVEQAKKGIIRKNQSTVPQVQYQNGTNGKINIQVQDLHLARKRIDTLIEEFGLVLLCEMVIPPKTGLYRVKRDKYDKLLDKLGIVEEKYAKNSPVGETEIQALKNRFNRLISDGYAF